jgi:uncharacterized protein (TIGR03437 family)
MSTIGVVTFDGAGNYTFKGSSGANAVRGQILATGGKGTYGVGANGLLYVQSLVDPTQFAYGGLSALGPNAFVASTTEGSSADLLIAIPAGGTASAASLSGNYSAGYVTFPNADVTMVREASFGFTADGAGHLANVAVSGAAANLGGGLLNQTVPGATYTLAGAGAGSLSFGAASSAQLLSGSMTFSVSADGNLFLAGTPGGYDFVVGMRSMIGTSTNASWSGEYFTGGFEDTVTGTSHSIDAFYGSWNSNGQGVSIAHDRYQSLAPQQQVFDYTFSSQATVQANGTAAPADLPYQFTLGAGGQAFVGTGLNGVYSLVVGFGTPKFSGSGVYLNPLGVVNAANFAPITNPIAPNEVITLYGSGLAASTVSASALPLPTTLGNVMVTINGQAAPLFYVSPGQISVLVPQSISPANQVLNATVQVINGGVKSNAVNVYTNYTAPGLFTAGGNGIGPAAAQLGTNFSLITASNPVPVGGTAVLYASGLGGVSPAVGDGAAAPSNPPAKSTDSDAVYVSGKQETLQFNGLTPGLAGLYQLNAQIVSGTVSGAGFADVATPDAYTSEAVLSVQGSASAMARVKAARAVSAKGVTAQRSSLPLQRVGR